MEIFQKCRRAQGRTQDILYVYCFMHIISATDLPISEHQGLCPWKKQPCFWTTGKRNTVWNHWKKKLLKHVKQLKLWSLWMKGGEGWVCWDMMSSMCQQWPALQFVSCAEKEESWRSESNLFGSIAWCWFPWHKLLPRLTQNNCCTVYRFTV